MEKCYFDGWYVSIILNLYIFQSFSFCLFFFLNRYHVLSVHDGLNWILMKCVIDHYNFYLILIYFCDLIAGSNFTNTEGSIEPMSTQPETLVTKIFQTPTLTTQRRQVHNFASHAIMIIWCTEKQNKNKLNYKHLYLHSPSSPPKNASIIWCPFCFILFIFLLLL